MAESCRSKCPTCGLPPMMVRVGARYWRAKCSKDHLTPIVGHPMRTQREAWEEWEKAYGRHENDRGNQYATK